LSSGLKPILTNSEKLLGTMSLPRQQKKSQLPWHDLALFAGVLAFLGVSLQSFVAPRTAPAKLAPPLPMNTAQAPSPDRSPASPFSPPAAASTEVLRLPCLHDIAQKLSSDARLVQVHAPLCAGDAAEGGSWRATNEASGEEILIFVNAKEKLFSTSYFSLKDGINRLVFTEDRGQGGIRREQVEIIRKAH
jgi:hypothetical protein